MERAIQTALRYTELPGAGRLGRHIEHDVRSLAHAVDVGLMELAAPIETVHWPRYSPILDQGDLGSCTGNALTGWLGCAPYCRDEAEAARFDESVAVQIYETATRLDSFPGSYPPDDTGSTGLAVCKAAKRLGYIGRYGWALTTAGMLRALRLSPVIVGIAWYDSFDHPGPDGLVTLPGSARVRGGHEVLVRGYDHEAGILELDNSWGTGWGVNGSFKMPLSVWQTLQAQGADVAVPRG